LRSWFFPQHQLKQRLNFKGSHPLTKPAWPVINRKV